MSPAPPAAPPLLPKFIVMLPRRALLPSRSGSESVITLTSAADRVGAVEQRGRAAHDFDLAAPRRDWSARAWSPDWLDRSPMRCPSSSTDTRSPSRPRMIGRAGRGRTRAAPHRALRRAWRRSWLRGSWSAPVPPAPSSAGTTRTAGGPSGSPTAPRRNADRNRRQDSA